MVKLVKRNSTKSVKKDNGTDGKRKPVKYVYPASRRLIFLVTGEPKESKYSYGVPIIPLHGYYKAKDGKKYTAKDLADYYVVLNLDKDDGLVDAIKEGVKVVVFGYSDDEVLVVDEDEEEGEGSG